MKRIIASLATAGVLVAGAVGATAISGDIANAQTVEVQTDEQDPGPGEAAVDEVLADLVVNGTIDQQQADAVKEALVAKHDELKAEREARREERLADRELIREFLEDGVISADELAELGRDHPFNDPDSRFGDAAGDGEISVE